MEIRVIRDDLQLPFHVMAADLIYMLVHVLYFTPLGPRTTLHRGYKIVMCHPTCIHAVPHTEKNYARRKSCNMAIMKF